MGESETGREREKQEGRGRDRNREGEGETETGREREREGEGDWSDRQAESAGVLKVFLIQSACVIIILICQVTLGDS